MNGILQEIIDQLYAAGFDDIRLLKNKVGYRTEEVRLWKRGEKKIFIHAVYDQTGIDIEVFRPIAADSLDNLREAFEREIK